ncbi:MAG: nucleotidyltransferase family protein [Anaerolineales bacterium]|nr:nucleotidyltransferase family protein [Anaerolineales bacterium]MCA9927606.1 nucleotidyltransferase family protein [Anaerolineales bacterium]
MNISQIQQQLQSQKAQLDDLDVQSLILFGSVARSEATATSDIDFLVTFRSTPTFDMYMDLKLFLEDLFGMPVDLVTTDAVRPQLRPFIEQEGIYVA